MLLRGRSRWIDLLAGGAARMPLAGAGVVIVIATSAAGHSYSAAGFCAALYVLCAAVVSPQLGRAMDAFGQRVVLLIAAAGQASALLLLCLLALRNAPLWAIAGASMMIGLSSVDIGATVRARWALRERDPAQRRVASMLESVVDEAVFIVTAPIVTLVAAFGAAWAPAAITMGPLFGSTTLAASAPVSRPVRRRRHGPTQRRRRRASVLKPLWRFLLWFIAAGMFLGSIEVLLVALSVEHGHPTDAGLALSAWAVGSAGVALLAGARLAALRPAQVVIVSSIVMAASVAFLPLSNERWWPIAVCLVAGMGASPALGAGFARIAYRAGDRSQTEAMAWASAAMGLGTSVGATAAGAVADRVTTSDAYVLPALLGILLVALALVGRTERGKDRTAEARRPDRTDNEGHPDRPIVQ
ncbi:MFS transporter [Phytoactinopolyspora limicola]|uniref:MFS transporter n=1 Tax=Phytoactinopolyspora limicola TaxID=2715536 RepID=UPI00140DC12A|nr:MFS transporter [Phytoactinopolyspora limicola]